MKFKSGEDEDVENIKMAKKESKQMLDRSFR